VVAQVAGSLSDRTPELARNATFMEIHDRHRGLPDGHRLEIHKTQKTR
jgi:hypothetical protein